MSERGQIYGIADKAWQVIVGCDPHMPCAPRCWARKTTARIVECQTPIHPERAEFFRIALTPDKKQWSGKTFLDPLRLSDPLKWRKPALIATGFHGDWGRLSDAEKDQMFAVMALCPQHRFMPLTKCPANVVEYLRDGIGFRRRVVGTACNHCWAVTPGEERICNIECDCECHEEFEAFSNVNIGCSVMNQAEADKYRAPMAALAAMGWNTHVWYEPATGPVDWKGWEFLQLLIAGGESGAKARASNPEWFRNARDWSKAHGIAFRFKQWGAWTPEQPNGYHKVTRRRFSHRTFAWGKDGKEYNPVDPAPDDFPKMMFRDPKNKRNLLDGVSHQELPESVRVTC